LSSEIGDLFAEPALSLDELYAWVKPFGPWVKFTAGVFENKDGIADYTDDIDEFGMGVFIFGEDGEAFSEPEGTYTSPSLANGFLTDLAAGPVTLQFLLASNYSGDSASALANGLIEDLMQVNPGIDTDERFFRLGGRLIIDAGVGTFAALFKTTQYPMAIINPMEMGEFIAGGGNPADWIPFIGSTVNWMTFGGYFDLTAVENLGMSLGYTGFLPLNDSGDVDSVLYSGVDLRATWTGIERLSLSTHNNISFAQGKEKDWMGVLADDDASFLTLYNASGATKELTEKFSVNVLLANIFSKTAHDADNETTFNAFGADVTLIVHIAENVEFDIGVGLDIAKETATGADTETLTAFSVPVALKVSF
jgi:hypothetical protein